ncbi:cyclic lactone autoinducer peptide AgrD [Staphylococcus sp. NAM3COL9]|nr:cyclic lactone autoinducer peptide [Staphylococcus sp. NAM3COL9]KRG08803.1 accessory gene regulator AgrD [Staphylococcus sp. NAM3COL9]
MFIYEVFINLITKIFSALGTIAAINPCMGYFDEPEVPKEISELHE